MRLNKEHFWRDRIYDYAVKLAAATFKRSTSVENFREYFWRDR